MPQAISVQQVPKIQIPQGRERDVFPQKLQVLGEWACWPRESQEEPPRPERCITRSLGKKRRQTCTTSCQLCGRKMVKNQDHHMLYMYIGVLVAKPTPVHLHPHQVHSRTASNHNHPNILLSDPVVCGRRFSTSGQSRDRMSNSTKSPVRLNGNSMTHATTTGKLINAPQLTSPSSSSSSTTVKFTKEGRRKSCFAVPPSPPPMIKASRAFGTYAAGTCAIISW